MRSPEEMANRILKRLGCAKIMLSVKVEKCLNGYIVELGTDHLLQDKLVFSSYEEIENFLTTKLVKLIKEMDKV